MFFTTGHYFNISPLVLTSLLLARLFVTFQDLCSKIYVFEQHAIYDFANNSHADFVCLQETLMSDDSLISAYRSKWNDPGFLSPALGKQG